MNPSTPSSENLSWQGVFPALVTPLDAQGDVDAGRLSALCDYLIQKGVHGLIPLGSTGEFYALTDSEREIVLRATLDGAAGRVPVIAGANGGSTESVARYCRQAEDLGCHAVMLAAPYYSLPTLPELFHHLQCIDQAIGLPIMLYNYPGRTGIDMTPEFVEQLTELPHIASIKESSGEMQRVPEIIRRCGDRMSVVCGCDTLALQSFFSGAVGWVGGVVNVIPALHVRLFDLAVTQQDPAAAQELFYRLLPLLSLMEDGGRYTQYVKSACGLMGQPVGPVRQPLEVPSSEELDRIDALLEPLRS